MADRGGEITPQMMAQRIADRLSDIELTELQRMLDEDSDRLWAEVTDIVRLRHPELFAGGPDEERR